MADELRRQHAENESLRNQNTMLDAKLAEQDAEIEALRKDAERYRFVRDANRSSCIDSELATYAMESLDEYVDAAMEDESNIKRSAIDAAMGEKA